LSELSAAYPSAADLSNWLPPHMLDPSAAGTGSGEGSLHSPPPGSSYAGSSQAGQGQPGYSQQGYSQQGFGQPGLYGPGSSQQQPSAAAFAAGPVPAVGRFPGRSGGAGRRHVHGGRPGRSPGRRQRRDPPPDQDH